MFWTLIYPSSGACDYSAELPHWSYYSWFDVCWSFGLVGLEWNPCCRLKLQPATWIPLQTNHTETPTHIEQRTIRQCTSCASACNTDTTLTQPHRNSNTHRTNNNTTNVVIQQNSRKLLLMDILMSETCWAHKKWNKIASYDKLVFYSSTILRKTVHQVGFIYKTTMLIRQYRWCMVEKKKNHFTIKMC